MKLIWAIVVAALLTSTIQAQAPEKSNRPVLRIAYFVPTDRQPEADRVERLDRVMTEVQRFFREGMDAAVKKPLTFELDRDAQGTLRVYEVRGKEPMKAYGRDAAGKVRDEVKGALAKENIDLDRETVVIFQVLLEWQGPKAVEIGPYVGGGDAFSGTAWVYDDAKLDAKLLAFEEARRVLRAPVLAWASSTRTTSAAWRMSWAMLSACRTNRERLDETATRGSSLMGAGKPYVWPGTPRRRTRHVPDHGLRAAVGRASPVHGQTAAANRRSPARSSNSMRNLTKRQFTLRGRVQGGPPVVSMVAYADYSGIPGDYDAISFTSPVDAEGRFEMTVADLGTGVYDLRLRALGKTGDTIYFPFLFEVDGKELPQVEPIVEMPWLLRAYQAFQTRDEERLAAVLAEAKTARPNGAVLLRKLAHYTKLADAPQPKDLAKVPAEMKSIALSEVAFEAESTGWGPSMRNQVSGNGDASGLIEVGGRFFESGLYAHAPARHAVRVNKQWKTFTTSYGLQDRHDGSVVFVINADGKELFRSEKITDHKLRTKSVDVSQATLLELTVENAADGNNSDWGVWVEPKLER